MSRDGSGTYTLPTGNPVVTGTTISSTVHNTTMTDIETEITNSVDKDGQTVITGTIDFNGNKIDLDADADTSITADTDDNIDFEVAGVDAVVFGWQSVADTGFITLDPAAFTADTTENTHRMVIAASNAITIPSGTTALASSLYVVEPNITATGTVTSAATVYIKDAPTEGGTNNFALWVDAGAVKFDGALTVGGATSLDGGAFTFNDASADVDFRAESNGLSHALYIDGGKDALAFGANSDVSSTDTPFLIDYAARTATAATNFDRFKVGGTNAVTVPAGTTALVTGAHFAEPNITATGTVTTASTVYIAAAPSEASTNYALWVDAGNVQFDGTLTVTGTQTFTGATTHTGAVAVNDTTASTSGTTGSLQTDGGIGAAKDIVTDETFKPLGDTAAGDAAAVGYTAAEGIIITGQGSTSDIALKNDADAAVLTVATGTTNVDIVGDVTALTVNADGDTSAGDNAAMGYTATEGLILTGQGSTNDITVKNDADAAVIEIPTGTTNVDIVGVATAATFEPDGDTSSGDAAAIGYTAAEGLILTGQGSTNDVTVKNDADTAVIQIPTGTTNTTFAGNVTVTGDLDVSAGNGITFDSGSNYLDDYEEGTWTPVLADAASGGNTASATITASHQTYTKVGRKVTVQFSIYDADTTGMTGANSIHIQGLPFTSNVDCRAHGSVSVASTTFTGYVLAHILGAAPSVRLYEHSSGGARVEMIVSKLTSTAADMIGTVEYWV